MAYVDYTDKDVNMQKWLEEIAPKYFDFDVSELYMTTQFGYMNEVMSTVENDTHHSVSIARREFYPTTAHYLKSFYKMAALQQISYPLANPAIATAILILRENDILTYGTTDENTGIHTFILDNSAIFYAANIPFMLDYPIKITVKENKTNSSLISMRYAYTARYMLNTTNSLSTSNQKYIKSRIYAHGSETLLLLKVSLRQCVKTKFAQAINVSPLISNISMDFTVGRQICNFEAFYTEAYSDVQQQLVKIPVNANPVKDPFCAWQMTDDETLRISFPNNPYFNPRYNSNLNVEVYTTLGEDGNFERYDGPLSCQINSERYPYNNAIRMTGKITGSSIGGCSMPTLDDFKNNVIAAYATNKTYTTDSDLQIMFDKTARTTRNRIIFSKRRDDCFERMYGAYMLLKDASGYVIPTNSLTCEFIDSDISMDGDRYKADTIGYLNDRDIIIKAGSIWRYHDENPTSIVLEPEYVLNNDGTYYTTENGVGMVPFSTEVLDPETGNPLYREITYMTDNGKPDGENPVYMTLDNQYMTTTDRYAQFSSDGTRYYVHDTDDPLYDANIALENTPLLDDEDQPVLDPTTNEPLYIIVDYGVDQRNIYEDGRNVVSGTERKFMVYPDTTTRLTTLDTLDYDSVKSIMYNKFINYLNIIETADPSSEEYQTAYTELEKRDIHNEEDAADAAEAMARLATDSYAYTNPFLIRYHAQTGVSAYYRNTFNTTHPLDLIHVEDSSILQFNASGISVYRNAIFGENFYKLILEVQPSLLDSKLHTLIATYQDEIADPNDPSIYIYAPYDGIVERFVYIDGVKNSPDGQKYAGSVYMMVRFFVGENKNNTQLVNYFGGDENVASYIEANFPEDDISYVTAIRVSSSVYYELDGTNSRTFKTQTCYVTNYTAGARIKAGNRIAKLRDIDNHQIRIVGMFNNNGSVADEYYIPFIFEDYNSSVDSYTFSAYIKTDDKITEKDWMFISDGIYDSRTGNVDDGVTIDPEKIVLNIGIFVRYDDENLPLTADENGDYANRYRNLAYVTGYTLANVYENPKTDYIKFLELYRFIRSTSKVQRSANMRLNADSIYALKTENTYTEIREIPLVRAEWARNVGSIYDLFRMLKANHDWIETAYNLLDNNFTINMKLYNTYGRSRYLNIGNNYGTSGEAMDNMTPLDSVSLKFKFGVKLKPLVDERDFSARFITFVRTYIENFNNVENYGMNIYMSDLYTKLNQKFKDEVVFLEYYGINDFDAQTAQVIESWSYEDINALGYNKYIPEFINLYTTKVDNMFTPTVVITFIVD